MTPLTAALRRWPSRYIDAVCRHPGRVVWLWALIAAVCLSGLGKLSLSSDLRINFGPQNPQLAAYDLQRQNYASGEYTLIGIRPRETTARGVLSLPGLQLIAQVTEQAWQLPGVTRVESLSNYPRISATQDGLSVAELLEHPPSAANDLDELAAQIMDEPALVGRLIAPDQSIAGILLTTHFAEDDAQATNRHMQAVQALSEAISKSHPQFAVHIVGTNAVSHAFAQAAVKDTSTLVPLMYGMFLLLILGLTGSLSFTLLMLAIMLLSSLLTLGLAGHVGMVLTAASLAAPHIITTLAIADGIHVMSSASASDNKRLGAAALAKALQLNMPALVLTTATTMIGFLLANFADSPPLRDLGNLTATGAFIALALSTSLLPAALILLRTPTPHRSQTRLQSACNALTRLQLRHPKALIATTGSLALATSAMLITNVADDDFTRYFAPQVSYRADAEAMDAHLTGLHTIEFSLPAPQGVSDPAYLQALDDFRQWWDSGPYQHAVMHVSSISSLFTRMNRALHADDPAFLKLPQHADEAAQYLLLYQLSLPYGHDIENRITQAQDASRFVVFLHGLSSRQTRRIIASAEQWLAAHQPRYASSATSAAVMYAYIAQRNINAMLMQLPAAIALIALLFMIALRSIRLGALSVLALALPIGVCFGLWALLSGVVNFTMAVVSGAVIGVVADDTIHLLSAYRHARQKLTPERAVEAAMRSVGPAVISTSLILVAGFGVLAQSLFLPNSGMAQLIMIAVTAALLINLLLVMPLAYLTDQPRAATVAQNDALSSRA